MEHDTARGIHQEGDVYKHTLLVLKNAKPGLESQFAALMHDVGKPATQEIIGDIIRYLGHEKAGGEIAEAMMRRLRFEKPVIKKVRHIVENHMRPHRLHEAKPKALRKFVREVGEETVGAILDMAEADALGTVPYIDDMPKLRKKLKEIQESQIPVTARPVLNGAEIMEVLGIGPGPQVGDAGRFLKDKEDEYAERGLELTKDEARRLLTEEYAG